MLFVEHIKNNLPDFKGLTRDTVVLTWEGRRKSRQKVKSQKGIELALALPTGTVLRDGDILYADDHGYIAVEAALEEVMLIETGSLASAAMVAHEIGNRHLPLSVDRGRIMTPFDAHLEEFFRKNGIPCRREKAAFEPLKRGHAHG